MNWSGFMKSTASRNRPSHIMLTTLSRSLVVVSLLFSAAALAKPRMPLPPFPPPAPVLYSESFDEAYTVWMTNAEVIRVWQLQSQLILAWLRCSASITRK